MVWIPEGRFIAKHNIGALFVLLAINVVSAFLRLVRL